MIKRKIGASVGLVTGVNVFIITMLVVSMLLLGSCSNNIQDRKDEFSQYAEENEIALVYEDRILYFDSHSVELEALTGKGEEANGGVFIEDEKIYFTTTVENGWFYYGLKVYECDLYGNDLKLLFQKDDYKTYCRTCIVGKSVYISYNLKNAFSKSSEMIDMYDIETGEYKNIDSGEECSLSNYLPIKTSSYEFNIVDHSSADYFEIQNMNNGEKKIVDNEFMKNTIYFDSLQKFGYNAMRADVVDGHIYLTYSIGVDGFVKVSYPHLVFEYDFENDSLQYKMLAFLPDSYHVEVLSTKKDR